MRELLYLSGILLVGWGAFLILNGLPMDPVRKGALLVALGLTLILIGRLLPVQKRVRRPRVREPYA